MHGACVRDGAWWWHRAAALLAVEGVESVAPGLPSCGEAGDVPPGPDGPGLAEDVAAVRAALLASDEPTTLVVHSYGGIVGAQAAAGVAGVERLVLVSSYLPEVGEGLGDFGSEEPAPALDVDPGAGTFTVRPELLGPTFLQDCDADVQREAATRTARQSLRVTRDVVGAAAWHEVPTTYLVCADDLGTSAARQRAYAARADRVVELAAGHHPFLSQPAAVRDLVLEG